MRSIAYAALIGTLALSSCKGEDNVNVYVGSGNWKLDGTVYQVYRSYRVDASNSFIGETNYASGENVTVYFNSIPSGDGVYNVKKFDIFNTTPNASDVQIIATGGGKNYGSMEVDSLQPKAVVTIVNGKINLAIQQTWMRNLSGPDSVKFSGTIIER